MRLPCIRCFQVTLLLSATILATSAAGVGEHFDKIFQNFQRGEGGLNVQRKEADSKRGGASERDLWGVHWHPAEEKSRGEAPPAKSQAFQRLEIISQAHERFGRKEFIDSNMIAKKFSETERNRGKADSGKEEAEQSNQEINRNQEEEERAQEKKWN